MKALVYHSPGQKLWEEKPNLEIQYPTDALVRILKTAVGINDLHIVDSFLFQWFWKEESSSMRALELLKKCVQE